MKKMASNEQGNIGKQKRDTSFELMRVLSMLMVCAYHWQIHGNNDLIPRSELCMNQIISFIFGSWGVLGVNLFFLLSFYFLIKKEEIIYNKYISLAIKVSFFGTVIFIIGVWIGATKFSYIQLVKSILGVLAYQYWFITVYIIVAVISPMLNKLLKVLSGRESFILVFIMVYVTYGISWIIGNELVGRLSCGITIYILIYILEKKIKNNLFEKYRKLAVPIIIIGIMAEILLSYLGSKYSYMFYKIIEKIQTTNSPYMLVIALLVFYSFKNLNLKYNVFINFLGRYSVGAYLLHGGASFIKNYLWDNLFKVGYYYRLSPIKYMMHYFVCILLLYIIGIICDFVYSQIIGNVISKIKNVNLGK